MVIVDKKSLPNAPVKLRAERARFLNSEKLKKREREGAVSFNRLLAGSF